MPLHPAAILRYPATRPLPEALMSRFGPTRGELKLRLAISLFGLALLIGAYAFNGIGGIASLEIGIIGAAFFGGSAIWSARRLWQWKEPDT
jgi:hypothetical protein